MVNNGMIHHHLTIPILAMHHHLTLSRQRCKMNHQPPPAPSITTHGRVDPIVFFIHDCWLYTFTTILGHC